MASDRKFPRWTSLLFLMLGAYIVLISLGVLPYVATGRKRAIFADPYHWQVTSMGLAFFGMGIAIVFSSMPRWLRSLTGGVVLTTLITPLAWVIFLSGQISWPWQIIGGFILLIGGGGALVGVVLGALGKPSAFGVVDDPVQIAESYVKYGRRTEAQNILIKAMKKNPARAAEFQKKLNEI